MMFKSPHILDSSFLLPPVIFNGINDFSGRHLEGNAKSLNPQRILYSNS